jgi:hypothetical protein
MQQLHLPPQPLQPTRQQRRHTEIHVRHPITRLQLPMTRPALPQRHLPVLRPPRHVLAAGPYPGRDPRVALFEGEGKRQERGEMVQYPREEAVLVFLDSAVRPINAEMRMVRTAACKIIWTRIHCSFQTMFLRYIPYDVPGFIQCINCFHRLKRREREFPLPRSGLGVELREVDVDFGEGVDNLFDDGEDVELLVGHVAPGVDHVEGFEGGEVVAA